MMTLTAIALATLQAFASPVELVIIERGTGDRVSNATVQVGIAPPQDVDERGHLQLNLEPGVWTLLIESPSNRSQTVELQTPTRQRRVPIFLDPIPLGGEIIVEAFRPTAHLTRHHVDAEMAWETPGTHDDAVRLVQALPGVNIQREYSPTAGEISVRGSLPGDNRYFLDGIEVPYLYHFNGYASVFPASQLDELDLYSSAYGVRYGDSVGAVVEARSDLRPPKGVTGSVLINLVNAGADLRIPTKKGWWIAASGRRSYHDLASQNNDQFTVWPIFHDFSVRAERGDEQRGTGIFLWGAGDRYARAAGELDLLDPVEATETPSFDYRRAFQIGGVRHHWQRGRVVTALVHDALRGELVSTGLEDFRTLTLSNRGDLHGALSDHTSYEIGWETHAQWSWLTTEPAGSDGLLVASEAPSLAWDIPIDWSGGRVQLATYGELHARIGPLRLVPGLRVGFDTMSPEPSIEPRAAVKWRVHQQTELKASAGLYVQQPETPERIAVPELPTTRAWEVGIGIEQTIAHRFEFGLDAYHKWLYDPLLLDGFGPPTTAHRGAAYGIEFTSRYRIRETFFLWSWFAVGRAQLIGTDGQRIPSAADQPLAAGLVLSWNIIKPLNVAVRYRVSSGLPWTPIESSLYSATDDSWVPVAGDTNSERYPLYQKIDLHTSYTVIFRRWSLSFSADLWLVPSASAQLYPTWNFDYSEQGWVYGPTIVPLVGVRAKF